MFWWNSASSSNANASQLANVVPESGQASDNHAIPLHDLNIQQDHDSRIVPTDEDRASLRKVPGNIPFVAYLLCVADLAERASYYGAVTVFNNFLQFPLPEGGNGAGAPARDSEKPAGALGQGIEFSNVFVQLFKFMAYTLPLLGAWISDAKTGRYTAIMIGVLICGLAHIIQVFGAMPSILQKGHGTAPFLVSLFLLAFGAGIFKPNILPAVLDQYQDQQGYIKTLKSGEKVIVDPEATITRITQIFYCFVNIGGMFAIATVYAEKKVGFWLAFLLPGIVYFSLPLLLIMYRKRIVRVNSKGSEVAEVFRIVHVALKRSKGKIWAPGFWNRAKPSVLAQEGWTRVDGRDITWTDKLVEDVRRTMHACVLFLFFPVWYLTDGGIGVVATSQASSMTKKGAPNDLFKNFNPITIIVFSPFLSYVIYPALRRWKLMPGRVTRITFGFTLSAISNIIGAVIQWYVYKTSSCGKYATHCNIGSGVSPLSVWAQVPVYVLGAMSECFCQITAYEIAYARSPKHMKAIVMSLYLFTNAISSLLGMALSPAIKDPYLVWVWLGPAIFLLLLAAVFHWNYRWMNDDEFMTYETKEPSGKGEKDQESLPSKA